MVKLKLKEVLQERGISMSKLSRMTDVSYNTVQILCRDPQHDAGIQLLSRIADALEISICDLLDEQPPSSQ